METIVVIGIIVAAGLYVARVFYLKFNKGKSNAGDGGCSACGCSNTCSQGPNNGAGRTASISGHNNSCE